MSTVRDEAKRIFSWEKRHKILLARLGLVVVVTIVFDAIGTVAMYFFERHGPGTEIRTVGDALFFSTVQLLTVSSQLKNPVTTPGRIVDVVLEVWAVLVVAGSAGAIATFFQRGD